MIIQPYLNEPYFQNRHDRWLRSKQEDGNLYNERTFYRYFIKDLLAAKREVIIYSLFVSTYRTDFLMRTMETLRKRNIEVFIFTRPTEAYDLPIQEQIQATLGHYEELGVNVFCLPGSIHEKAAIIDREILWEGSLNILSQKTSREMMRRTVDENAALQVIAYLGLNKKLAEGYRLRYEKLCHNLAAGSRQSIKAKITAFLSGATVPIAVWLVFDFIKAVSSLHLSSVVSAFLYSH